MPEIRRWLVVSLLQLKHTGRRAIRRKGFITNASSRAALIRILSVIQYGCTGSCFDLDVIIASGRWRRRLLHRRGRGDAGLVHIRRLRLRYGVGDSEGCNRNGAGRPPRYFKIEVTLTVQQFSDQDGSRLEIHFPGTEMAPSVPGELK